MSLAYLKKFAFNVDEKLHVMYKHPKQAFGSKVRMKKAKLHSTVPLPKREQPSMEVIGE